MRAAVPQGTLIMLYDTAKQAAQLVPNADLQQHRDSVLCAASQVCPRKTDWIKVYTCKRFKDENSAGYWDRLREIFINSARIENPVEQIRPALVSIFVQGLGSKVSENI